MVTGALPAGVCVRTPAGACSRYLYICCIFNDTRGEHGGQTPEDGGHAIGIRHPGRLPLPAAAIQQLESPFDPRPHPVPQPLRLVRLQVGLPGNHGR